KAYGVSGHRHLPEIVQGLERAAGQQVGLTFVPHLTPMIRGIHSTLYAQVPDRSVDLQQLFEQRYADEPFVDVMPAGSHPETRSVRGANMCRLAIHRPQDGDLVVVLAVIDNLVKGASGQAIQNMNIALGLDERLGLEHPALMPGRPANPRAQQICPPGRHRLVCAGACRGWHCCWGCRCAAGWAGWRP